jgi:6-phosphogluconolactonase
MHRAALASALVFLGVPAFAVLSVAAVRSTETPPGSDWLVYFGTYTGETSKGIYVSRLDGASGALAPPALAVETPSPSFLAVHPTRPLVYAVNEVGTFEGKPSGSVSAFAIRDPAGALRPLNQQPSVGGGPAHLVTDRGGRNVLVANYGGGSVAVLPIAADGSLRPASAFVQHTGSGANPERQKAPHAHSINVDVNDRFAYVADLGTDKVMIYRFTAEAGSLAPAAPPFAATDPGAGPRHFAFRPDGRVAYVINEITCTVTAFGVNQETGALTALQTVSSLPAGETVQAGYSTAEVQVHPSGKWVYGSNRGHDSIAVFAADEKTGRLTLLQHQPTGGRTPRGFGIDPSGRYLLAANQRSDSVLVFAIDPASGRLAQTAHRVTIGSPVAVKFAPVPK